MDEKVCSYCDGTGVVVRILEYPDYKDSHCCEQCAAGEELAEQIERALLRSSQTSADVD